MKYYDEIVSLYGGRCYNCLEKSVDIQHRLANSLINQDRFPLFIDSIFNLIPLCRECHQNKKHMFKINDREATLYEEFLHSLNENKEFFDANTKLNHRLIRENDKLKKEIEELKAYHKGLLEGIKEK